MKKKVSLSHGLGTHGKEALPTTGYDFYSTWACVISPLTGEVMVFLRGVSDLVRSYVAGTAQWLDNLAGSPLRDAYPHHISINMSTDSQQKMKACYGKVRRNTLKVNGG